MSDACCQLCNACQDACNDACYGTCQTSCESCNACQDACNDTSCTNGDSCCQNCNACQDACNDSCYGQCQTGCEVSCQTSCESCNACQDACNDTSCTNGDSCCQNCNSCNSGQCSACNTSCNSCNTCDHCDTSCQYCNTCQACNIICNTCQICNAGCQLGQTPTYPPPELPYNVTITVDGLNVTISFTKGEGGYYVNLDRDWVSGEIDMLTSGTSFNFSVPNYNTTYTFRLQSERRTSEGSVRSSWSSSYIFTTKSPSLLPGTPSSYPEVSGRGEGSLSLNWGASANATSYVLRYKHYSSTYNEVSGISNTSYTLTGLEFGTSYYLSVKGVNQQGSSEYTSESTATTLPKTPSISTGTTTNNSIQINVSGMHGNYSYVRVHCYDNNWNVVNSQDISYNGTLTFSNLIQGSSYFFQAWSYLSISGTTLTSANYSQINVVLNTRPQNWNWSYTIKSGGTVYNTVASGSQITAYIMTALEWNAFTQRINEFRRYRGLPDYGLFTPVSSGSNCTPDIINHAVYAVNAMGFSVPTVSSGNIPASVFNNMRDAINSII